MKRLLIMLILLLAMQLAWAQNPDSIRFVQGIPMDGEDSAQTAPVDDQPPYDKLTTLKADDLPAAVQKELNENELFSGWRSGGQIEYDKNTRLYWIHFSDSGRVRSYAFNAQGAPVSIREKDETVNMNQK